MPTVFGETLTKEDYLRRVGSPSQCFGITPIEYSGGKAEHIQAFDVDNAGGLRFSVAQSKGMDILKFSYKGINLGFETKAGISSPWIADEQGFSYRNYLGAGFMYTAGLSNVGGQCEDEGFYHYAHGILKDTPAENISSRTVWDGDECSLFISGDVRDSAFFGRNLLLHRDIQTKVGSKKVLFNDIIENQGFKPEQIMLLYHINIGYPVLCADTQLYAPVHCSVPLTSHTTEKDPDYAQLSNPIDENEEYLHSLSLMSDQDGMTTVAVWNPHLSLGLSLRFNCKPLSHLVLWKCMLSGDYALGVLPSTCLPFGRIADRQNGNALILEPFRTLHTNLEIGILDGLEELQCYRKNLVKYNIS